MHKHLILFQEPYRKRILVQLTTISLYGPDNYKNKMHQSQCDEYWDADEKKYKYNGDGDPYGHGYLKIDDFLSVLIDHGHLFFLH